MLIGLGLITLAWVLYYPTNWFFDLAWSGDPSPFIVDLITATIGGVCIVSMCLSAIIGIGVIGASL
jgi:hypothetical protein